MDLFDDLPPPKVTLELPSNGKASSDSTESNIEPDSSRKRTNASQIVDNDGSHDIEPTRKRLASDHAHVRSSAECQDSFGFICRAFVCERRGERPEMQDAHIAIEDAAPTLKQLRRLHSAILNVSYFAVFDGHNGSRMSKLASQQLHNIIFAQFPPGPMAEVERDARRVLVDSYKKLDDAFLRDACKQRPVWKDGSTAASALLVNDVAFVANLGDTRVVACVESSDKPRTYSVEQLTTDHQPTDFTERLRIQTAGAVVKNGRINEILEVSRAFGDYTFKKSGVISVPEIHRVQITPQHRFLLIACDGLFKVFTNQKAIETITKILDEARDEREGDEVAGGDEWLPLSGKCSKALLGAAERAATELANSAVRSLSGDNVTVMIVLLERTQRALANDP